MVGRLVHGKVGDLRAFAPTIGCLMVWGGFLTLCFRDRSVEQAHPKPRAASVSPESAHPSNQDPPAPVPIAQNGIGMEFAYVPAGTFLMGSDHVEPCRAEDERRHRVRIGDSFYMGVHEVTVGQFARFVLETGYRSDAERSVQGASGCVPWNRAGESGHGFSWRKPSFPQTEQHPVTCVTWNDTQAFCRWLSEREGRPYRLPTEAEWEYACRAGSNEPFSVPWSDDLWPNANLTFSEFHLGDCMDHPRDGFLDTAPVGLFPPNALGLHDMHGNVREWCADWYERDYPRIGSSTDPTGPCSGAERVNRGAGFRDFGITGRSANRSCSPPDYAECALGFRVLCETAVR